jgi:hypothetical protein
MTRSAEPLLDGKSEVKLETKQPETARVIVRMEFFDSCCREDKAEGALDETMLFSCSLGTTVQEFTTTHADHIIGGFLRLWQREQKKHSLCFASNPFATAPGLTMFVFTKIDDVEVLTASGTQILSPLNKTGVTTVHLAFRAKRPLLLRC